MTDSELGKGEVMKRIHDLCKEGTDICTTLEQAGKDFRPDPTDINKIGRLCTIQAEIRSMSTEGKARMGSNPTDMTPPNQAAYGEGSQSATQQALQNARFKLEHTSAHLQNAQENYDKTSDRLAESSKKLHDIIARMKKLEIEEKSLKDIKETLVMGIRALGELREKWGKIVVFFQMISNIIECSLSTSLKRFLHYSQVSSKHVLKGYPITSLKKDMIYCQAFEAAKIAHLVTMISSSYVEVSQVHLIEKIAGLGKLLAYDCDKDKYLITRERLQLFEGCQEAQTQIRKLVLKRREEFNLQIEDRIETVRRELGAVIPAVPDNGASQKTIQDSVKRGIEKAKEADSLSMEKTLGDELAGHYVDI